MIHYYQIDNNIVEFEEELDQTIFNYPKLTETEANAFLEAREHNPSEEEKKANLASLCRYSIGEYDWVVVGDTEYYLTAETISNVIEYRKTLRKLLQDWHLYTSAEIVIQMPPKPIIEKQIIV